jgi:hypothetical protein
LDSEDRPPIHSPDTRLTKRRHSLRPRAVKV